MQHVLYFLDKGLTDFNWQKAMIQSRIMEKVQDVGKSKFTLMVIRFSTKIAHFLIFYRFIGERISSQSWLEQMRMLAKERSLTSVLLLSIIGLVSLPILVCVFASAFTFLGFVFVEGI